MHFFHQFYFSFNRFTAIRVHKFVLFVDFHRYFSIRRLMQSNTNYSICSLSNLLPNYILVKRGLIAENHTLFVLGVLQWVNRRFHLNWLLFFFFDLLSIFLRMTGILVLILLRCYELLLLLWTLCICLCQLHLLSLYF